MKQHFKMNQVDLMYELVKDRDTNVVFATQTIHVHMTCPLNFITSQHTTAYGLHGAHVGIFHYC